jgi:hypothetical protein
MAAPLTALGRKTAGPAPHVCRACGSARDACRGFAGDAWYCTPCVPPALRFPWEPGYAVLDLPAIAAATPSAPADLLSGFAPA